MFKRILIGGWGAFLVGLLLAFLFPGQVLRLSLPIIILGILLVLSTLFYGAAHVVRQRVSAPTRQVSVPLERTLVGGWLLLVGALLMASFYPKWGPEPEVLFVFSAAILLASMAYGFFLMLRQIRKR